MIRQEVIDLFAGFVKVSNLNDHDIRVIFECCVRELAARNCVPVSVAKEWMWELNELFNQKEPKNDVVQPNQDDHNSEQECPVK